MGGRVACAMTLSVVAAVAASCGGTSNSSSSDPNSSSYDPAETTLKAAGLEVCNQTQSGAGGGLDQPSGVAATRSFLVAPDCMGATTSPNQITVYQFKDRQSLDAGMQKIKAAHPKGQMTQYGATVILATGPNAAEYMADVKKALPAPS